MAQVTGQALREMCYWLGGGGVTRKALQGSADTGLHPSWWAHISLLTPLAQCWL